ncbi:MFS transporter [Nocardioides lianchengensis]|uniref:MFS transporter, DHA1 family, inner membrane transport protein n=1 Tax=Nocardioides lianchengensis TaxID=1045774 RepID=A0A1G6IWE5_9ACTN|nr:MFS transporter [Nocardioides lianchengensis]NYG12929.1 DHA1 family inner membrane transport protein [Nocardioides lianchengensis]SDC10743.1 MFS transporter, DHA1 family, inner membrane transport protein [Nocardioides lianchengensis]
MSPPDSEPKAIMTTTAPATSTDSTPELGGRRFVLAVLALAVGGFAIGTTEFVTMGLLPQIAEGIGVSEPKAGHVISAYALGVVVGVPILSFFAARLPRRGLLVGLMGAYGAFNLLSAAASGYGLLTLARFLDGLPHGAYFGVASLVAASLAEPRHRGRAVASVMLGLSFANVVGVPAATWVGQAMGWRAAYVMTSVIALLTMVLVLLFVPSVPGDKEATGRQEARDFFSRKQVWLTMAAGAIGFGGLFAVYSYIATTVTDVAGLSEGAVPFFLLAFGLGMVGGTWLAGELAAWSVFRSLLWSGVGSVVIMLVFWAVAPYGWWLLPVVFSITAIGSILVTNLQLRLMDVAGDAVTLGAAMNHAALNTANALGAWLGGLVIAAGYGYRSPALVGAALSVLGIGILLWSAASHRRDHA